MIKNKIGLYLFFGIILSSLAIADATILGNSSFDTDTLFVDGSNDRVGIGTTNPIYPFHTVGSNANIMQVENNGDSGGAVIFYTDLSRSYWLGQGAADKFYLRDVTANAYRWTVDSSGSMGIGTDNPAQILHVNADSTSSKAIRLSQNEGFTDWVTNDNKSFLQQSGITAITYDNSGNVGIGTTSPDEKLHVYGSSIQRLLIESTDNQASLTFKSDSTGEFSIYSPDGTDNLAFYKGSTWMTITSDGEIIMPAVYGDTVGGTNRDLYIDNTGKLGYVSSSIRYKENIVDFQDASWLYDLRPVTFDYKDGSADHKMGLIAEEVEAVNQEIVSYSILEDGSKQVETVSYSKLVTPLLVELQNLNDRIAELETRLAYCWS